MHEFNERLHWIDILKGIACILVMWGHVSGESPLKYYISTFHVALFLFSSGFLYALKRKCKGNNRILAKCFVPYLAFSFLAIIINIFVELLFDSQITIKNVFVLLYKTFSGFGIGAIWFLSSYCIGLYVFWGIVKNKNILKTVIYCFILICLAILFESFMGLSFWDNLSGRYLQYVESFTYYPVAAIIRGMVCSIFIISGYGYYYILQWLIDTVHKVELVVISVSACLLNYCLAQISGKTNFSLLLHGNIPFLLYINGILGGVGVLTLVYLVFKDRRCRFLEYCGKNSLVLMGTHMALFLPSISIKITIAICDVLDMYLHEYIKGGICVLIMLLIEYPIIEIIKKKMPFLLKSGIKWK